MAYWEENRRVGEQLPVFSPSVDVFAGSSISTSNDASNAFDLDKVFVANPKPGDHVAKARKNIGLGEDEGILLYSNFNYVHIWLPLVGR